MRNYGAWPFHIQTGLTEQEQQNLLDLVAALSNSPKYGAFRNTRPGAIRFMCRVVAPQVVAQLEADTLRRSAPGRDIPLGFSGL